MKDNSNNNFLQNMETTIDKYSPEILTGLSVVGLISAVVSAIRATPFALELIKYEKEMRKKYNEPPMKWYDYIKVCWKVYLVTCLMTIATGVCIITSNRISAKRKGALLTAYGLTQETLRRYQEKVIEEIGAKKEKLIREKIAEDVSKSRNDIQPLSLIDNTQVPGEMWFEDTYTGAKFKSTMQIVKSAELKIDNDIINDSFASVNDFYDIIGVKHTKAGEAGWNVGSRMGIDYISAIDQKTLMPYIIIDYKPPVPYKGLNF